MAEKNQAPAAPADAPVVETAAETNAAPTTGVFSLSDVYSDYADAAANDPSKEVLINLLDSLDVEFTADFRTIKKGTKLSGISRVAFDLYNKNGVVKLLAERRGPSDADLDKEE